MLKICPGPLIGREGGSPSPAPRAISPTLATFTTSRICATAATAPPRTMVTTMATPRMSATAAIAPPQPCYRITLEFQDLGSLYLGILMQRSWNQDSKILKDIARSWKVSPDLEIAISRFWHLDFKILEYVAKSWNARNDRSPRSSKEFRDRQIQD